MKRIFLFAVAAATMFAACDKNDGGSETNAPVQIKTEVVSFDGDFRHITYDSVCVFSDLKTFENACAQEGITAPEVDFASYNVMAVTGVAPAEAKNINAVLTKANGEYVLDIDVESNGSQTVNPRKWSLLLKTEAAIPQQLECNIRYDMKFDAAIPIDSLYFNFGNHPVKRSLVCEGDMYLVEIVAEDSAKFLSAFQNGGCDLLQKAFYGADQLVNYNTGKVVPSTYSKNGFFQYGKLSDETKLMHMIVEKCDYDAVLAPLADEMLYCSKIFDFVKSSDVGVTAYSGPASVSTYMLIGDSSGYDIASELPFLAKGVGVEFTDGGIRLYRDSKLNMVQLQDLIYSLYPNVWFTNHYTFVLDGGNI